MTEQKSETIQTIDELKSFLIKLIRKDVEEFKILEGSGLLPYKIQRTSEILEKLGMKVYPCKFCDINYPIDLLWQISGCPLCIHCKKTISNDDSRRKYK